MFYTALKMSRIPEDGSLLHEYDPEFEEKWDRIYEESRRIQEQTAAITPDKSPEEDEGPGVETEQAIGNIAAGTVDITPIQQKLF
jgi:hypothetical protein